MKEVLALFALSLVLASSGCISESGDVSIKFSDNLSLNLSESGMPGDITEAPANESNETEPDGGDNLTHDLCADKLCDDSVTTCPDSTVVTCGNECDQETGNCSSCTPDCSGHDEEPCDLDCGVCRTIDEARCECVTEFYCEGNGICTSDEWPDGEDCIKFDGCDDSDKCTTDTFDPNIQECVHVEACCESDDPCLLGTMNPGTMQCEFDYTCCGNALCDQPGDLDECPEECEFDGEGEGDLFISGIDPTGNEIVFLEGDSVDLTGWMLSDSNSNNFTFPEGFVIQGLALIHTVGCVSDNNETDLYWGKKDGDCRTGTIWLDSGETATLSNSSGGIVDEYTY